jgi:DNA adenine methylase
MTDMATIRHPALRYHGGKFRLAPWIISYMPAHVCYVEPFGGAASVLLQKARSYAEVYNDIDGDVVNLFRALRDPTLNQRLQDACVLTPYARDEFCSAYEETQGPVERARRTVVRACMGYASAAATFGKAGFRGSSKRLYATPPHLWERYPGNLAAVCQRLQGVIIENKDALQVMAAHDAPTTLHYIDPPYLPDTRIPENRCYRHEMTPVEHERLLAKAATMAGTVIISGYESELYNDTLATWQKASRPSRISACRGSAMRNESVWIKRGENV